MLIETDLNEFGWAVIKSVLSKDECSNISECYENDEAFRSQVIMARHGFGRGEYKYFSYPLPQMIAKLRQKFYPPLAQIANGWNKRIKSDHQYPKAHQDYIKTCHAAGQIKPTPLILKYGEGDYNCLHQDIYGTETFPLQMAILLSQPGADFTGGEFVLTEQRPRMQSKVGVIPLNQGDAVIFPVRYRPVQGVRGTYKVNMRHGVSRLTSGIRYTLGIIFHDAQ